MALTDTSDSRGVIATKQIGQTPKYNLKPKWSKLGQDDISDGDDSDGELQMPTNTAGTTSQTSGSILGLGGGMTNKLNTNNSMFGNGGGQQFIGGKRYGAQPKKSLMTGGGAMSGGALGFMGRLGGTKGPDSFGNKGAGAKKKQGVAKRALDDFDDEFSMDASL